MNMEDQNNPQTNTSNSNTSNPENSSASYKRLLVVFRQFITDRLSILDNANYEQTIEGIERDIEFRGFNLWILMPAIIIASIGLNSNSTAVIVGAMLISPLMGPIMGIGLSVGINDFMMLKRALRNLAIMIAMSLITSTIFFFIIPINDASSELLARINPDIRDVLIGFFGGLAGILAGQRKERGNVIPGVAIATALMPPLCTAGYGLATLQLNYFLGAIYLFLINAFFIALATVLVVRYLQFPVKTFLNKSTERKAKNWLALTVLIMIVPASYIFYNVVQQTIYYGKVNTFIDDTIAYEQSEIVKREIDLTDSTSHINIVMFGKPIPEETITQWQSKLNSIVENTKLRIFQNTDRESLPEVQKLVDMYTNSQDAISTREEEIAALQNEIERYQSEVLPIVLMDEIKVNYPEVESVRMGRMVHTNFKERHTDAVPSFIVQWNPQTQDSTLLNRELQLTEWLELRLKEDSIALNSMK